MTTMKKKSVAEIPRTSRFVVVGVWERRHVNLRIIRLCSAVCAGIYRHAERPKANNHGRMVRSIGVNRIALSWRCTFSNISGALWDQLG